MKTDPKEIRPLYIAFLAEPENDDMTDGMFCGQNDVSVDVLRAMKEKDAQIPLEALAMRRAQYASMLKDVDSALFKKAIAGDTKAADLVYRRFENWSPKQADEDRQEIGSKAKTFAELIAEHGG